MTDHFCSACGKSVEPGTHFCPNCAHPVDGGAAQESSAQPAVAKGRRKKRNL
ncbi:zinc-ribbon domain-containing protein, partial [Mycolicibacterium austroafricanum]|uniref:zinc-ribbon domain-containing protein n=1 Tax=Mycolicibacterium austroafricanum TaxID=39687 RepID=UPI00105741A6